MRRLLPRANIRLGIALHDAGMAGMSFLLSLYLRLGSERMFLAAPYWQTGVILFTCICMIVFVSMRLYRGLWRYASTEDLGTIARAVTLSILVFSALMFLISRMEGIPRSTLVINWLVLLVMLSAPRFAYRSLKDRTLRLPSRTYPRRRVPLLLIGVNDQAELFLRDLRQDREAPFEVVALVDDDKRRDRHSLHGVRIYWGMHILPTIIRKMERKGKRPQRLVLAGPFPPAQVRECLKVADEMGLTLGMLPRLSEFKSGAEDAHLQVQPVAVEDLLGRPQTMQSADELRGFIAGRRVLVTGAGGSIGSELCRQIAQFAPERLILFELGEYALYQIDAEIAETAPVCPREAILGDVRSPAQLKEIFARTRPECVFHAAAIKHVPLAELNPIEALETNALGTRAVAEACIQHGVQDMVLISTDKAVRPASVMGASKRLAEMIVQAAGDKAGVSTRFTTVRFGNVLGSTGSVIPLFQHQIARGGPLTVTHPEMMRYFMTIREAAQLVIRAARQGAQGSAGQAPIFVLDMGEPVKIDDLARQLIRMSGLTPDVDISIIYTGLRPGENLSEELFYDAEALSPTPQEGILQAAHTSAHPGLGQSLDALEKYCRARDASAVLQLLARLVPGYNAAPSFPLLKEAYSA